MTEKPTAAVFKEPLYIQIRLALTKPNWRKFIYSHINKQVEAGKLKPERVKWIKCTVKMRLAFESQDLDRFSNQIEKILSADKKLKHSDPLHHALLLAIEKNHAFTVDVLAEAITSPNKVFARPLFKKLESSTCDTALKKAVIEHFIRPEMFDPLDEYCTEDLSTGQFSLFLEVHKKNISSQDMWELKTLLFEGSARFSHVKTAIANGITPTEEQALDLFKENCAKGKIATCKLMLPYIEKPVKALKNALKHEQLTLAETIYEKHDFYGEEEGTPNLTLFKFLWGKQNLKENINNNGLDTLGSQSEAGNTEIVDFILENISTPEKAFEWAAFYWPDVLERVLVIGRYKSYSRNKALIEAVESGKLKSVKLLLKHGAKPDTNNNTPFFMAALWEHFKVANLLLNCKINPTRYQIYQHLRSWLLNQGRGVLSHTTLNFLREKKVFSTEKVYLLAKAAIKDRASLESLLTWSYTKLSKTQITNLLGFAKDEKLKALIKQSNPL